jgi:hypothetical protein
VVPPKKYAAGHEQNDGDGSNSKNREDLTGTTLPRRTGRGVPSTNFATRRALWIRTGRFLIERNDYAPSRSFRRLI